MKKLLPLLTGLLVLTQLSLFSQDHFISGVLDPANVPTVCGSDTNAEGTFVGTYDMTTNELNISVNYNNITSNLTLAHIHDGAAGLNGPVVFNLSPPTGNTTGNFNAGPFVLTAQQETKLLNGELYVNLHSTSCPSGVIRDQIDVTRIEATIDGTLSNDNVVPPCPSQGSGGNFTAFYNFTTMELVVTDIDYNLSSNVTVAHIHEGPAGTAGPVVFNIDPYNQLPPTISGTNFSAGPFILTEANEASLLAGELYMNIHGAICPGGEIRDQLMADVLAPIPTLGQWGLIILSLLIFIVGIIAIKVFTPLSFATTRSNPN